MAKSEKKKNIYIENGLNVKAVGSQPWGLASNLESYGDRATTHSAPPTGLITEHMYPDSVRHYWQLFHKTSLVTELTISQEIKQEVPIE